MADKVYQPAGDAQEEQFASAPNPVGLYRNVHNGREVGVLDPIQGDAVIRNGFVLVEEGRDAAMKSQEDMDRDYESFQKKKNSNPDDEIAVLQAKLDAANARLAAANDQSQADQDNIDHIRATADQSDTAAEQSQLVPERNIKAPVTSPSGPEAPKGDDLKAAQAAKKEAAEPSHTAEQDLKAAGLLDDDGKGAKAAEDAEAAPRGVDPNATLKPGATAKEQLSDVFQSEEKETPAEKASTPAPSNVGNRGAANVANDKKKENK